MQKPHNAAPMQHNIWETLMHNIQEALTPILINLQQYDNSSNSGYVRIQDPDIQEEISTIISTLIEGCQLTGASEVIPVLVRYYFLASLLKDTSSSVNAYISKPDSREDDEDGYCSAIKELKEFQSSLVELRERYPDLSEIISQAISASPRVIDQRKKRVDSVILRK